jgi:hydrogenase maturation protease
VNSHNEQIPRPQVVVIGYGNTLRSDDGAGQQVATLVEDWQLPQVRSLAVHQLTPELAAELATAQMVIFVDAYPESSTVQVHSLTDQVPETTDRLGHTSNPRSLLNLARTLYDATPTAWWVLIPAVNFDFRTSALAP